MVEKTLGILERTYNGRKWGFLKKKSYNGKELKK
jgi:hypothetical protein